MKKILCLLLLVCFCFVQSAFAATVPSNTSIFIRPNETVTSKNINVGEIMATITSDVVIDDNIVFKAGDKAVLYISDIQKARCWGNPGKLTVNNGWAYDSHGNKQKILFTKQYYGQEKNWPKVMVGISIFILWPLALFGFVHGGQAQVLSTQEIEAYLASQYNF